MCVDQEKSNNVNSGRDVVLVGDGGVDSSPCIDTLTPLSLGVTRLAAPSYSITGREPEIDIENLWRNRSALLHQC